VIENFLVNSKFCGEDLNGVDKPAVILTQFLDYALFSARPLSALSMKMNASISNKPCRQGQAQNSSGTKKKCPFIDVCYNFNKGICQKTAGQCTSASGTPLRLICDHMPDPQ
jgi:hypothetical protein